MTFLIVAYALVFGTFTGYWLKLRARRQALQSGRDQRRGQ